MNLIKSMYAEVEAALADHDARRFFRAFTHYTKAARLLENTPERVVKKTISLPFNIFAKGKKAAEAKKRNFSNYLATLIAQDGDELERATSAEAGK